MLGPRGVRTDTAEKPLILERSLVALSPGYHELAMLTLPHQESGKQNLYIQLRVMYVTGGVLGSGKVRG